MPGAARFADRGGNEALGRDVDRDREIGERDSEQAGPPQDIKLSGVIGGVWDGQHRFQLMGKITHRSKWPGSECHDA